MSQSLTAKAFVPSFKRSDGQGLESGFVATVPFLGLATAAVLVWAYFKYVRSPSEFMRGVPFQVTSAGFLGTRAQCLDTPGHEKCGSSTPGVDGFLSTRGEVYVSEADQELSNYYASAISEPGNDTAERMLGKKKKENLVGGNGPAKHSEAALEGIARGTR